MNFLSSESHPIKLRTYFTDDVDMHDITQKRFDRISIYKK